MQWLVLLLAGLVGMAFATGSPAQAQVYVGAHAGANFVQDSDLDGGSSVDAEASLDPGFVVGGVVGYRIGIDDSLSVDVEGEFSYRLNDIDEIAAVGSSTSAGGEAQSFLWMANAWVNWEIGDSGFAPYVGGGFGGVHIDINDAQVGTVNFENVSDFVLGGQVGAGLGYALDQHVVLSLDYRFMFTEDAKFENIDTEYQTHAVMLGVKYLF